MSDRLYWALVIGVFSAVLVGGCWFICAAQPAHHSMAEAEMHHGAT